MINISKFYRNYMIFFVLNVDLWHISKRCWFQMFDLQQSEK